jgi:hypothetical protein
MGLYSRDQDQDSDQELTNLNTKLECRRPLRSSSESATNQRVELFERRGAVYSVQDLQIAPPDWVRPRRPMLESFAGCPKEL